VKSNVSKSPLISIITVCYNAEEYIEQCIQSVLSQDFDNFEYIIIDGGSTDATLNVIEKYQDELAYWHSKPDRGISHAFNQGLEQAKGEWIVFLNADDCYCNTKVLSSIASVLRVSANIDLVYGQIQIVKRQQCIEPISGLVGQSWEWKSFRFHSTIPHPASFTHKRLFERLGLFDENFRNALDYEFYLRAGKTLKVLYVSDLWVWMRTGGMSTDEAYRSYAESRDAQIKHAVFGHSIAWVIYIYYVMRIWLGKLLQS